MRIRLSLLFATLLLGPLVWALPVQAIELPGDRAEADPPTEIVIEPEGNQMKFATTVFSVEPGKEVRLVLENTADSPAMIHNVVLLTTSDDATVREVGQAGSSAGRKVEYVPDHDAILAATDLAEPGETVEVTFTAPDEPGEHTYLCTYPGHWATMQGTMHVEN
jgi:azurin